MYVNNKLEPFVALHNELLSYTNVIYLTAKLTRSVNFNDYFGFLYARMTHYSAAN